MYGFGFGYGYGYGIKFRCIYGVVQREPLRRVCGDSAVRVLMLSSPQQEDYLHELHVIPSRNFFTKTSEKIGGRLEEDLFDQKISLRGFCKIVGLLSSALMQEILPLGAKIHNDCGSEFLTRYLRCP
ncbi:hypothetical protein [Ottowia thiooxydans]|uniref:hypothetical protein n=1 Tax=Ottowia thiooxydans TaxID=219182 RepID=UPI00049046EB|nr:hypothetical protein [Ottowia thiooxydans]